MISYNLDVFTYIGIKGVTILKADKEKRRKYRHTAKRIYEVLKEKHPDKGLIAERTMRRLVTEEREKLYNGESFPELPDYQIGLEDYNLFMRGAAR